MRFSIIVPVYNVEMYLKQCVDSILQQTYNDFELILVDDGSRDQSGHICDIYKEKDSRIKVIHKINGGLSDARNIGMEAASGDYCIFIDSDDWIEPGSIQAFAETLDKHPVDVLITRFIEVCNEKKIIKDAEMSAFLGETEDVMKYVEWLTTKSQNCWPAQKIICSLQFIRKHQLMFLKGFVHEDMDWTSRLLYVAETAFFCEVPWYNHRLQRSGSIMSTMKEKNIMDALRIATIHYADISKEPQRVRQLVFRRIMKSVYTKVKQASALTETEQAEVAQFIDQNNGIFKVAPGGKYLFISLIIRLLGAKAALCVLKRVSAWK